MKNCDQHLEKIARELSDSVFSLSDEGILAEAAEMADPDEEAERTLMVLRNVSRTFDNVSKHLTNLGHSVNPKRWRRDQGVYQNRCIKCGSLASFTLAGQMRGEAFDMPCCANGFHAIYGRKASR